MKNYFYYLILLIISIVMLTSCNDNITNDNKNPFDIPHTAGKPVVVDDVSPKEGGLGTRVVVSGSNFGNNKEKIKLFFNDKESLILKVQDNAIYAMVPKQPGDLSKIRVIVLKNEHLGDESDYVEAELEDIQFVYHIKATVTTVAGVYGVKSTKDGSAFEASFTRVTRVVVDETGNTVIASDDGGKSLRYVSLTDNKVTSLKSDFYFPWGTIFSEDYNTLYCLERNNPARPVLFYSFSKESNWLEGKAFYDQKNESDNYIVGKYDCSGITIDEKYVYVLRKDGRQLYRIDRVTGKLELIGDNLGIGDWGNLEYNRRNKLMYVSTTLGEIWRFDPYHIPEGMGKPFITHSEMTHVAGAGKGVAEEGNGKNARFGGIEDITSDPEGNLYIADYTNHLIWKMDEHYNCKIIGGVPGEKGYKDGKPSESLFNNPKGVAVTPDGTAIYVADTDNSLIRCISIQ